MDAKRHGMWCAQTEREVVLREVDGTTTTVSLTDVYADKAEQGP